MAKAANPIRTRVVSILCLLVLLFVAIPYATCASPAGHAMANMPAGHCDPCCPASISATAACCLAHPQPSVPAAQPAQPTALTASSTLPGVPQRLQATPIITRTTDLRRPPPPLITNLRI